MDSQFHALPPLKRLRLIHQHDAVSLPLLPAKKRKLTRADDPTPSAFKVSSFSLPAKKRVWALPPHFDLNLDYEAEAESEAETKPEKSAVEKNVTCTEPVCEIFSEDLIIEDESVAEKIVECTEPVCEINPEDLIAENEDGVVCSVCKSKDGDPSDPIVFCDGCDLMVHATCYGNPLAKGIPEGDWFCLQCEAASRSSSCDDTDLMRCCLCPGRGGAMKKTEDGRWAHVVCALYVPEVFFKNPEGREGIDLSRVPKRRWKARCYVCESVNGCAIECSEMRCELAFHVSCGLDEDLCIEYMEGRKGGIVAGFCRKHTDLWEKQQETGKFKIVARKN